MQQNGVGSKEPKFIVRETSARPRSATCAKGAGVGTTCQKFGALVPPDIFMTFEDSTSWGALRCHNMPGKFSGRSHDYSDGSFGASSTAPQHSCAGYAHAYWNRPSGREHVVATPEQQAAHMATSHNACTSMLHLGPPENSSGATQAMQDHIDEVEESEGIAATINEESFHNKKKKTRRKRGDRNKIRKAARMEAFGKLSPSPELARAMTASQPFPPGEYDAGSIKHLGVQREQQNRRAATVSTLPLCPVPKMQNFTSSAAADVCAVADSEFSRSLAYDDADCEYMRKAVQEYLYEEDGWQSTDPCADEVGDAHIEPPFLTDCDAAHDSTAWQERVGWRGRLHCLVMELCQHWNDFDGWTAVLVGR